MSDNYSEIFSEISELLQKGKARDIAASVQKALDAGAAPADILQNALMAGMNIIGEKFKKNEVFVPEGLVAFSRRASYEQSHGSPKTRSRKGRGSACGSGDYLHR